jgi:hypothetical protein
MYIYLLIYLLIIYSKLMKLTKLFIYGNHIITVYIKLIKALEPIESYDIFRVYFNVLN